MLKLQVLLTIYGLFMVVVGGAFLALPSGTLGLYGAIELSLLEEVLARCLGALMIGFGTMCWAARSSSEAGTRDPLLLGIVVSTALWSVVCLWAAFSIGGNWFFWFEGAGFAAATVIFLYAWRREAGVAGRLARRR